MLVRNRPTPGTPIAKSASFRSANSLIWRGRHDLLGQGLQVFGPERLHVERRQLAVEPDGGRTPTLSRRSDALRWTICEMACLKLNVGAVANDSISVSAIGVHPEEDLAVFHRRRVFRRRLRE
jgi:hypothetical protein